MNIDRPPTTTPLTDAREQRVAGPNAWSPHDCTAVHSDFARGLETKLAAAEQSDRTIKSWNARQQQLIRAMDARQAALELHLIVILPMAKGYASAHPVGNNWKFCEEAAAALETSDLWDATKAELDGEPTGGAAPESLTLAREQGRKYAADDLATALAEVGRVTDLNERTYKALTQGIKCDLAPGGLNSMPDALQRCHNSVVEAMLLFPNVNSYIGQIEKNCTDIYDAGRATEKAALERIAQNAAREAARLAKLREEFLARKNPKVEK